VALPELSAGRLATADSGVAVIEFIVPAGVACAEAFTDVGDDELFDEERAVIAKAVAKRRGEFAAVRYCARKALAELGVPPAPLVPGERGAPQWPARIVGSMTHCANYRAAAVARATTVHSIGIDAEPHEPLPDGVLDAISLPDERVRAVALAAADDAVCWDRLLFCAKEAVYKTWFPLTRAWLGFEQADVAIDRVSRTFTASLLVGGPVVDGTELRAFDGRWLANDQLLLVAIAVLPRSGSRSDEMALARWRNEGVPGPVS
jgi:4'-phosphopantetheinyl transferase EntD